MCAETQKLVLGTPSFTAQESVEFKLNKRPSGTSIIYEKFLQVFCTTQDRQDDLTLRLTRLNQCS